MAESTGTQGSFPGHVILILADPNEIEVRVASRGKKTTVEYTRWLQEAMKLVYPQGAYVTWIDTRGMSLQEVVRAVADVIHRHEYAEHDPDDIFDACIGGSMLRPETDPPSSGT